MKNKLKLAIREQINSLFEGKNFLTHDNGGRAFSVHKDDEFLYVFKQSMSLYDNVLKIFEGDKEDEGSSVLIELAANGKKESDELYYKELKHKYLFVGTEVYSFECDDEISEFHTQIGNSDVPYPVALSKESVYFMLDKVYVDKTEFPNDTDWSDAYTYFYENKNLKKHKFHNLKLIEKSPLREQQIRPVIRKYVSELIKEEIIEKRLGQFSLDSGQAIFVDPAHLDDYKESIEKMLKGEFKSDKNQVKSLGKYNTGLYLSLFGGDGTFDVYGVFDSEDDWSHLPYKLVIHTRNPKDFPEGMSLYEGTSNYYPGLSDDGTSDTLASIRDKTSPVVNKELKKMEKKILNYNSGVYSKEEEAFWQKWMYANLITTSLQDGFFMEPSLIEKALECYEEVLSEPEIKEFTQKSYKNFKSQVGETLEALKKVEPMGGGNQKGKFYAPGFMDRFQRNQANSKKDL